MSRSRCAWIWRGSAVGLSRSSGMFTLSPAKPFWPDLADRQVPIGLIGPGQFRPGQSPRPRPGTMAPLGPEAGGRPMAGEAPIKQAVKWIEDQLRDNPDVNRLKLVDEASRRFDLSPLDADFLFRHLTERTPPK